MKTKLVVCCSESCLHKELEELYYQCIDECTPDTQIEKQRRLVRSKNVTYKFVTVHTLPENLMGLRFATVTTCGNETVRHSEVYKLACERLTDASST